MFLFASCSQNVKIYPAPGGIELSGAFIVEVEGKDVHDRHGDDSAAEFGGRDCVQKMVDH